MPPKAKARFRRPAALIGRRRPAAKVEEEVGQDVQATLGALEVAELSRLQMVWFKKALYYHREVELAAKVESLRMTNGEIYLECRATGTKDEGLLRALTTNDSRRVDVHVCRDGCTGVVTAENLVHGKLFEEVAKDGQAWFTNLEKAEGRDPEAAVGEDEMAEMRRKMEERTRDAGMGVEETPKEKKKKKEKGKKEKKERVERPAEGSKRRREISEDEEIGPGQKDPEALFSGTALDPSPKERGRILKKARRLGRKKKRKKPEGSSSSTTSRSSSSSSTSGLAGSRGLFSTEKRMKVIARRYPGALAAAALGEAREHLMTTSGTLWDVSRRELPPIATQYARQHLASSMSPAMLQEALTISTCLDGLLQGRAAGVCDVLAQRLKSLETVSRGTHWSIGRQLELVRADATGMTWHDG